MRTALILLVSLAAALLALGPTGGCAEEEEGASDTTAPAEREVSSAQDAVAAAVDRVKAGTTVARTEHAGSEPTDTGVGPGVFVYTYFSGGEVGRMESVEQLREPVVPFPLAWEGDTYYLDNQSFSVEGTTGPGLAVAPEDVRAGLDSEDEGWRRTAIYLGSALAFLRIQDPLRLLEIFSPAEDNLPSEGDGQLTLRGRAETRDLVGADAYYDALELALEEVPVGPERDRLLPEQVELTLALASEDWRPLELLIRSTLGQEPQEILVRWERGGESPASRRATPLWSTTSGRQRTPARSSPPRPAGWRRSL